MIRSGNLQGILINGRPRLTPEAIFAAERGPLASRPVRGRPRQEKIPEEVTKLLNLE
jgi:hypothetical protein